MPDADPDEFDIDLDVSLDGDADVEEFNSLIVSIEERCKKANLKTSRTDFGIDFDYMLEISFPCGRETVERWVADIDEAKNILAENFEVVRFISGYDAFYRIDTGDIVATFQMVSPYKEFGSRRSRSNILHRIFRAAHASDASDFSISIARSNSARSPQLVLKDFSSLARVLFNSPSTKNAFEININNLDAHQHDDALKALESITDALFLQIEAESNAVFNLIRAKSRSRFRALNRTRSDVTYTFPKIEYNHQAMVCYWYAVSAHQMPLMQFLAFYQAIEFYFPIYSERAAQKSLQNILLQPNFRPDRSEDILKLIQALKNTGGRGYGNERSQLFETVKACVTEASLRAYIAKDEDAKNFFSKGKDLNVQKISFDSSHADILKEISDRIYQLRCRIVHTKQDDGEETKPLLPYTKEEELLRYDIDLIKFVSLAVIGASGSTLSLDSR